MVSLPNQIWFLLFFLTDLAPHHKPMAPIPMLELYDLAGTSFT
jgi:hypothetical protein